MGSLLLGEPTPGALETALLVVVLPCCLEAPAPGTFRESVGFALRCPLAQDPRRTSAPRDPPFSGRSFWERGRVWVPPAGPPSFLTCQSPRGALGPLGVVGITLHMPDGTFSGESSAFWFPSFLVRFSMGSGTSEACGAQAGAITGLPPDPTFQGPLTRPHLGLCSYCALCPECLSPSLPAPPPGLCVHSACCCPNCRVALHLCHRCPLASPPLAHLPLVWSRAYRGQAGGPGRELVPPS